MKKLIFPILLLAIISSCTNEVVIDNEAESKAITETLNSFYSAAANADYDLLKSFVTEDFMIFDVGVKYDFEGLVAMFKHNFETMQLEDFNFGISEGKAEIFVDNSFLSYLNSASGTMAGQPLEMKFLESALFVKVDGSWKIKFIHSTMVAPPAPEQVAESE